MDRLDFIIGFEEGTLTDGDIIDGFAKMIKDGSVWSLQGMYGRMARDLIDGGFISEDGKVLKYPDEGVYYEDSRSI